MTNKGFSLPIILILLFLIASTISFFYLSKSKAKTETTPPPTSTPASNKKEAETTVSPSPLDEKCYTSSQTPDFEIEVVRGGFNLINFNPKIKDFTEPKISIDKGKQKWMFIQTYTPSKKTNVYSEDNYFYSILGFAPPQNISGKCDITVSLFDKSILKKTLYYRINVVKSQTTGNIALPPKDIKAALIGVGTGDFQYKIASLETDYSEATNNQGKLKIEYLGNVPYTDQEVYSKTDEIVEPFITSKGKSLLDYDLVIVHLKNYAGYFRTDTQLKKVVFCCENLVFLHEFAHLTAGVADISYENTLLPPDPLHYSSFEKSNKFSNPTLKQLGFESKNGVWILIDEWGFKTQKGQASYRVVVRNTGNSKDNFDLSLDTNNLIVKTSKAPINWFKLSADKITLGPNEEKTLELTVNPPNNSPKTLFGVSVKATSQSDQSVWDRANIYFETSE